MTLCIKYLSTIVMYGILSIEKSEIDRYLDIIRIVLTLIRSQSKHKYSSVFHSDKISYRIVL